MNYIRGYDGLRAVSIILVVVTHLGLYAQLPQVDFIRERLWLLASGTTGVNIFFSLSGFLITSILLSEKAVRNKISFLSFYIKRFLRLLPPLLVFYTALVILMAFRIVNPAPAPLLYSCFYAYNFVPLSLLTAELSHTWSLAIEEQFYLVWPFIIGFFSTGRAVYLACSIVLLCIAGTYFLPNISVAADDGHVVYLAGLFKTDRWFIPAVAPIMIGACFSVMVMAHREKISEVMEKKAACLFLSSCLFISPIYLPDFLLQISYIFQAIGISGILVWIFFNQRSRLSEVLEFRPLAYLGKISYGVYVYQGLFLTTGPHPDGPLIQRFPLNIILTLMTAVLSYEFIERPALRLKGKLNATRLHG